MKAVLVYPNPLESKIVESSVPEPGADEVLIKVVVAGCNPKDWKHPLWHDRAHNSGDDIAGYIEKVGEKIYEYTPGDRVAAFHKMQEPGGAYAEYAIAPAATTFLVPSSIELESAATIPLAGLTATLGLFVNLKLPTPWVPATEKLPVFINGGATAVGVFAMQLLKLANIGPIIVTAGKGAYVAKEYGADYVVDYRGKTPEQIGQEVRSYLKPGQRLIKAFDAVSEKNSNVLMSKCVDDSADSAVVMVLPKVADDEFYSSSVINFETTRVKFAHVGDNSNRDLAFVMCRQFSKWLAEGNFRPHPHVVAKDGLAAVGRCLDEMKKGNVSGFKYVYRIADTPDL
ncbi:chaperonin 10-like protein [Lipomyces arxii]|uniref:chaperonin 10-like protein n=1 Tax=Lipomyces arxii TaxID=56418 RepID=UPI0034CE1971